MKLSIVSTLYRSALFVEEFCRRAKAAAEQLTDDYEIILVNDGSPDDSLARALALKDKHIIVVDLSRNFGHHKAIMSGLEHSRGERVFLIDSDLEEEPEWLAQFDTEMKAGNADAVFGIQKQRKGGWFERVSGNSFYACFHFMTGLDLPKNFVTARLMTRRYVDALLSFKERELFLGGLFHLTGFTQHKVAVTKHYRGESTYTFSHKLALLVNAITSTTSRPLMMIFYIGLFIFLIALGLTGWLIVRWLFYAQPIVGWTSLMVSVWLLGGLIISFIGLIGIYLSKVFIETKQRPYTIVKEVHGQPQI